MGFLFGFFMKIYVKKRLMKMNFKIGLYLQH